MFNKTAQSEKNEDSASNETELNAGSTPEAASNEQVSPETTAISGEDWEQKHQELQDQFTRLAADFDNYRKRVREEQEGLIQYGMQKAVLELVSVLDNLDRASNGLTQNSDPQVLFKSFEVMQKQLLDAFEKMGVKKIQAVGQPFDPQFHDAISQMESKEFPENTIIYEAQSGYMLGDKVIRPAMVAVSAGAPQDSDEPATGKSAEPSTKEGAEPNPFKKP